MPHVSSSPWTTEQQAEVARLLMAGQSFSQIAGAFETTRSAVAGVVHRNRMLRLVARPARPVGRPPTKIAAKPPGKKVAMKKPKLPPVAPIRIFEAPPEPPAMRSVGLTELRRFGRECRWAVDEDPGVLGRHLFCGAPAADEAYCRHHAALAYVGKGKGYG